MDYIFAINHDMHVCKIYQYKILHLTKNASRKVVLKTHFLNQQKIDEWVISYSSIFTSMFYIRKCT